jgi:hypothetical protein
MARLMVAATAITALNRSRHHPVWRCPKPALSARCVERTSSVRTSPIPRIETCSRGRKSDAFEIKVRVDAGGTAGLVIGLLFVNLVVDEAWPMHDSHRQLIMLEDCLTPTTATIIRAATTSFTTDRKAAEQLAEFLFEIDFLTAHHAGKSDYLVYNNDPELFSTKENQQNKILWSIHSSYRNFLRIT